MGIHCSEKQFFSSDPLITLHNCSLVLAWAIWTENDIPGKGLYQRATLVSAFYTVP